MISALSHYRLEQEIGRGGMGVVYAAVDTRLGRRVAIKVLLPEAVADSERRRRFLQEARAASALNHPNIVTIYEVDEDAGTTFIVMELVDGAPLDRMLTSGPLPLAKALEYATQLLAALEAAHAAGIIHRDIKPANIIITRDGRAKVLDFGLAKLVERAPGDATMTAVGTRVGMIMGTAAYMSPEQAEGRAIDARSDIFSAGAVLYEMLAGRRPFTGGSELGVITAILKDNPPPLANVPRDVDAIVCRALAKSPDARYPTAAAMRTDLASVHTRLTGGTNWRRRSVLVPAGLAIAAAIGIGAWQTVQARGARWARQDAIPQIEQLQGTARTLEAVRLARTAERYAPDEIARLRQSWLRLSIMTDPPGASIDIKNYGDVNGRWEPLGLSPVNMPLPFAYYRLRIVKSGYTPTEMSSPGRVIRTVKLVPVGGTPEGMVPVDGVPNYSHGVSGNATLPDFWIDRLEVSNRAYKKFVDAGGYRDRTYWREPFVDGDRELPFEEAIARFRDATGRPGPAVWELGSYPEGQADFPVGGISWFEAAAYARFMDKRLPTIFHWYRASGADDIYSGILSLSNFDRKGPVRTGERQGLGPYGTLDMAGNVKEWCSNLATGSRLRYILGGGWDEPSYRFAESEARNPWDRLPTFGVRLIKDPAPNAAADVPVGRIMPDPKSVVPASDAEFEVYKRFYAYDRTPLDVRMTAVDDASPDWRKESVSFAAAYGGERIPAYFFIPKHATPPYQTVVLFPSAYALSSPSSAHLDLGLFDYIMKSGRALLYPVYYGTYERRGTEDATQPNTMRDMQVRWAKDFFRAVDYLETRKDVDMQRLGYFSLSMGAYFGPIPVSLEPRVKLAVFVAGGLRYNRPPEIQPANFMPHVKVPVLLVDGRDDFAAPLPAQQRFIELIGTAPDHKRHVALDGGHVPNDFRAVIREVLDWLDKYFGPVK